MKLLLAAIMIFCLAGCTGVQRGAVQVRTEVDLKSQIQAELKAEMDARLNAQANAQVGVNNRLETRIEDFKQEISAGRDANTHITEFSKEMLDALRSANDVSNTTTRNFAYILVSLITAAASVLIAFIKNAHKKAEVRAEKAVQESRAYQNRFERAIAAMPPHDAKTMFPDQFKES